MTANTRVVILGSFNLDYFWSVDRLLQPGETKPGELTLGPGGKGFNQAIAARRLHDDVAFIGALGWDAMAATARDYASANQLNAHWVEVDTTTGAASIVRDASGQNQIVVALGANLAINAAC
jgi:ribokinase